MGIPYTGLLTDTSVAAYLQGVAEQTVFQDPWAYDQFGFTSNRFYWAFPWTAYTNRAYSRLNGVVISGNGGLPSPSVKLDTDAGQTNNLYLGVYGYNYESAGEGRLYVRDGGSLVLTGGMVVGKEGRGWVQQTGGRLQVNEGLTLSEQPSGAGSYTLAGGLLAASQMIVGNAGQGSLQQSGGSLQLSNLLSIAEQPNSIGSYTLTNGTLAAPLVSVGKAGLGGVQQNGGSMQVADVLTIAEQPGSSGSYTLAGGLLAASQVSVGKAGEGGVQQSSGSLEVSNVLTIAEQASSSGTYSLIGGALSALQIQSGQGSAVFTASGGQLSFGQFGSSSNHFDLLQTGGTLALSNTATIYGNYTLGPAGTLDLVLGDATNLLVVAGDTATLAGNLSLRWAPGFIPLLGQQFLLVTAGAISGSFGRVLSPGLLPGHLALTISNTPTSVVATVVDGRLDSDGNGLPDWWELQYFGSANSGQSWTNSFIGDGVPNGVKYALYADPTVGLSADKRPQAGFSNGNPTITYREHAGGQGIVGVDYTADNLTYTVLTTTNLLTGPWLSGTNWVEWTGDRIDNGDGSETVCVQLKPGLGIGSEAFLRLTITH